MKRMSSILFAILLCFLPTVTVCAEETHRIVDGADILSDSEEAELEQELNEISVRQQFDVIVVTTFSLNGKNITEYADDFYDYNGYGMGSNYDGAMLCVDMDTRQWYISTCGYGITALTDAGIEYIGEAFLPYLSEGEYYKAFSEYARLCDEFVTQAKEGTAYDVSNMPKKPFPAMRRFLMSAALGIVVAFVYMSVLKGQMKSVRAQRAAVSYITGDGLNLQTSKDRFLYVHREKERLPEQEDRNGGSSTHVSSSGRSHGGGGGKF